MIQKQKVPTRVNSSELVCILESNAILKSPCLNLSNGGYTLDIHNFDPFKYCNPKVKIMPHGIYVNKDFYTYDLLEDIYTDTEFRYLHSPFEITYADTSMNEIAQSYTLNIEDYIEWEWSPVKLPLYVGDFSDIESLQGRKLLTIAPVRNSSHHHYLEFATVDSLRLYIPVMEMYLNGQTLEEER